MYFYTFWRSDRLYFRHSEGIRHTDRQTNKVPLCIMTLFDDVIWPIKRSYHVQLNSIADRLKSLLLKTLPDITHANAVYSDKYHIMLSSYYQVTFAGNAWKSSVECFTCFSLISLLLRMFKMCLTLMV